ncbi:hypothetical protein CONLIGDRAFT_633300 [Coniochaeta ligniaria NRRL 30616]|uniref:Uncharacterized protein n=1 Tax=Coniochaeta ligniaria NRRL 30616 TaxID=1408157 RepID=A0A1J7INT1_9PEZI|nr:hypothetical protein CONLIGDRAFT_633300 [Coniochaeta ligniaria NRRL 30616]
MASVLNTVSPESTTAGLAGNVPLEPKHDTHVEEKKDTDSGLPGTFPETPAADLDKQFSVNPLPATDFAVNPVKLEAGEKVPKDIASNGIHDHVTLDKESYEKSDRIPGLEGLTAPTNLAPTTIGTIIPESSLGISPGDFLSNSAAPQSSTAALAANVPLEQDKAPEVVKESQEKSGDEVGSSGMEKLTGEKIEEKAEVENELLSKVPEAPSTAEGTSGKGTDKSENTKSAVDYITEGAGVAGVALLAAGLAAKDAIVHAAQSDTAQNAAQQVTDAAASAKDTVVATTQSAAQQATDAATSAKDTVVASSQSTAQQATETAYSAKDSAVANTQSATEQTTGAAVNAKDAVVATSLSAVESTKAAATNAAAQLPDSVKNVLPASVQAAIPTPETQEEIIEKISPEVPVEVKESIAESGQGPEATVNTAAVEQKSAVESELLKEVDTVKAFDDKSNQPADNVPSEVKESITEAGNAPEAASSETAVDNKAAVESELLKEVKPVESIDQQPKPADNVPEEVKESIIEAERGPEAASSSDAVNKKSAVESELLKEVETTKAIDEQAKPEALPTPPAVVPLVATPAPAADVKTEVPTEFPTTVTNGSEPTSPKPVEDSAALPILPKAVEPPAPAVDTPAKSEAPSTPAKPAAPATSTTTPSSSKAADSPATAERKKKHRLSSFLGKIIGKKDKP